MEKAVVVQVEATCAGANTVGFVEICQQEVNRLLKFVSTLGSQLVAEEYLYCTNSTAVLSDRICSALAINDDGLEQLVGWYGWKNGRMENCGKQSVLRAQVVRQ